MLPCALVVIEINVISKIKEHMKTTANIYRALAMFPNICRTALHICSFNRLCALLRNDMPADSAYNKTDSEREAAMAARESMLQWLIIFLSSTPSSCEILDFNDICGSNYPQLWKCTWSNSHCQEKIVLNNFHGVSQLVHRITSFWYLV